MRGSARVTELTQPEQVIRKRRDGGIWLSLTVSQVMTWRFAAGNTGSVAEFWRLRERSLFAA